MHKVIMMVLMMFATMAVHPSLSAGEVKKVAPLTAQQTSDEDDLESEDQDQNTQDGETDNDDQGDEEESQ